MSWVNLPREQGARVPGRLVASAKSWLCYARVTVLRRSCCLGAKDEVAKVSPVEASHALSAPYARGVERTAGKSGGDGQGG